jgi:hypothetical protein
MNLQTIPGIGKAMEKDLNNLGVYKVEDLKNKDPEKLYADLCDFEGVKLDPCVLYTFRCAVYFSKTKDRDPQLLKWWNWKDKTLKDIS